MLAKKEMSFLPEEENVNSITARFVRWITTVGRFVIVFTELIVICAFLSRFWLDRTNSDLSEVVRQQKAILESTVDFENDYNQLQKRLKLIKNYYQNQPEYQSCLTTLVESTPAEISYTSLEINRNSTNQIVADINLSAYNESSIVDFITNLFVNPKVSSVDIKVIEKKPKDTKYNVDLSLVFNPVKK